MAEVWQLAMVLAVPKVLLKEDTCFWLVDGIYHQEVGGKSGMCEA